MKRLASCMLRIVASGCIAPLALGPVHAAPTDKARVTGLTDVAFGTIANLAADQRAAQNLCVYSSSPAGGYSVTASGSGAGGAFTLSTGSSLLPYEVEWSETSGATSGSPLLANVPLAGLSSPASNQNCSRAPTATASLVVILRGTALGSAASGAYSGSLTLIVAAN